MYSLTNIALAALLFISVHGHMIMKTPSPMGNPNNSPLLADGSDFPCKLNGDPSTFYTGETNTMAIGDPQTLSFTGSAVHGGGSCQVSLTTDLQPTKDSKFMVIKSIEGGCPASVAGNLPADPNGSGASTFQYTIPDGISPGQYTIAWSWVNKIGNREFYMNCGRAEITAAKKKRYAPAAKVSKRQATSFPEMFVANVGNGCTTPEDFDYNYPNPGSVTQSAGTGPYTMLSCAANAGSVQAASPTGAAVSGASAPAVAATSMASSPAASSSAPAVFASGAASPAASSAIAPAPAPAPAASSVGTAPVPAGTGSSSSSGSATQTVGAPCTSEGDYACGSTGLSFQRCASGQWSAIMSMAAGVKCTSGTSATLNETTTKLVRKSAVYRSYKA